MLHRTPACSAQAQPAFCLSNSSAVGVMFLRCARRHSLLLDAPESYPLSARRLWVPHLQASLQATAGQLCPARRPAQLPGACQHARLHWPVFCKPDGGHPLTGQLCWQRGEACFANAVLGNHQIQQPRAAQRPWRELEASAATANDCNGWSSAQSTSSQGSRRALQPQTAQALDLNLLSKPPDSALLAPGPPGPVPP